MFIVYRYQAKGEHMRTRARLNNGIQQREKNGMLCQVSTLSSWIILCCVKDCHVMIRCQDQLQHWNHPPERFVKWNIRTWNVCQNLKRESLNLVEIQPSLFNCSPFNLNEHDKNGDYTQNIVNLTNPIQRKRGDKMWSMLQENPQFTIATPCIARLKVCR